MKYLYNFRFFLALSCFYGNTTPCGATQQDPGAGKGSRCSSCALAYHTALQVCGYQEEQRDPELLL